MSAVLAAPDSAVVAYPLASPDLAEDLLFLAFAVDGDEHRNRFADSLLRGVAEQALRPCVPRRDDAVDLNAYDCVVG